MGLIRCCRQKFADHPLAVRPLRLDGQLIREMILIQRREDEVDFSVLQQHGDGPPRSTHCPHGRTATL